MKKIGNRIGKTIATISMKGCLLGCLLGLLTGLPALAAVRVESLVDRNELSVGDTFELRIVVSSSEAVDLSEPTAPRLDSFEILNSGTSSSTSSKLVQGPNGMQFETQRSTEFVYQIAPKKIGTLVIPAFTIDIEGKKYQTKAITLRVGKAGSASSQRPRRGGTGSGYGGGQLPNMDDIIDQEDELFNQLLRRRNQTEEPNFRNAPKNPNEAFSVQLDLDKTDVYEGEQIVANWFIYTRGNILSLDRLKFPDLRGFWKEIIEEVPALNFTQEVVNGIPYRRALLASHALFPIRAGVSVIDEFKIRASVALAANPLSTFGMGKPYTYSRSSERVKINVKPLPVEGKPQDFSGAVGQFEIQAVIEGGNQFPINQPFALKVHFEGAGNAKLIELPNLNLPTNLEVYNTKNEAKFFKNGRSYKEFEVLLIPRQEGDITVPAIQFSMFDPQTKKYVSKHTEAIPLKIVAGTGVAAGGAQRIGDNAQKSPEKKAPSLPDVLASYEAKAGAIPLTGFGFWALIYGLITLILGWKAKNEFGLMRSQRNLRSELAKRLKKVSILVDKNDWRATGVEMTNTIYFVLGEVSGQGGANMEIQKLLDLAPPSVRRDLGSEFQKSIEIFQILSFAPEAVIGNLKEKSELKKNFSAVTKLLEKSLSLSEAESEK